MTDYLIIVDETNGSNWEGPFAEDTMFERACEIYEDLVYNTPRVFHLVIEDGGPTAISYIVPPNDWTENSSLDFNDNDF